MESLLIIGIHTRPAVFSAKNAGYRVFSVDYFGSRDLRETAYLSRSILQQKAYCSLGRIDDVYSSEKLAALAEGMDADGTILTSTVDINYKNVIGNSPRRTKKINNKEYQLKRVRRLGFQVPESETVSTRENAIEVAKSFGFPVVMKPVRGAGGRNILYIRSAEDMPEIRNKFLLQKYIPGTPISASTLSYRGSSVCISTSTQILGSEKLNQTGFNYCGNITPYEKETPELLSSAEKISRAFKVIGWNGIDFVDCNGQYIFMEINPRFQGTLECIENSYEINLVEAHIKACKGELIEASTPKRFSARMTLYAGERSLISRDMSGMSYDIPTKNAIVEKGEPITTVISTGKSKRGALKNAGVRADNIYQKCVSTSCNLNTLTSKYNSGLKQYYY